MVDALAVGKVRVVRTLADRPVTADHPTVDGQALADGLGDGPVDLGRRQRRSADDAVDEPEDVGQCVALPDLRMQGPGIALCGATGDEALMPQRDGRGASENRQGQDAGPDVRRTFKWISSVPRATSRRRSAGPAVAGEGMDG